MNRICTRVTALTLMALAAAVPAAIAKNSNEQRVVIRLVNSGIDPDASGKAVYRQKGSQELFKVQVEQLAPGPADLQVAGVSVGTITVNGLGRGEIKFRNPQGDDVGVLPLTFDPRGQRIDVLRNGQALLSVAVPTQPGPGGVGSGTDADRRTPLVSTGVIPGADGKVRLRSGSGKNRFNVEIEDVPAGSYTLRVDGVVVATIDAQPVPGTTHIEGEVEFAQPSEPGKLPLTFDPRGKLIEVLQGDTVVLQQLFPN
ncbi:MAG: hypothetical protein U0V87_00360 [Acidobacteriota bacterium]